MRRRNDSMEGITKNDKKAIVKAKYENGVLVYKIKSTRYFTQEIFLISDAHFDAISCDRDALKKDLDKAIERGALIVIGGDWFDAMQGRFDPRRNMDELRPEYRRENYFDVVVTDTAEFLKPYSRNIIMVSPGNHELSVRKNSSTDLTDRLVYLLNHQGSPAVTGSWKGWIKFQIDYSNIRQSINLYYSHSGGDGKAPVTRGVIATNRQAVYLPDADVVWNGHNHQAYIVPITRERLNSNGVRYTDIGWFVRSPGYKREWNIDNSFAAVNGTGPAPVGCVVLTLHAQRQLPFYVTAQLEITP